MKIINLTPHAVTINGILESLTIPPSGMVARVETATSISSIVNVEGVALRVSTQSMGQVVGLPAPEPEGATYYLVSLPVAQALAGSRPDVLAPGPLVRDSEGRPVACDGLVRVS